MTVNVNRNQILKKKHTRRPKVMPNFVFDFDITPIKQKH